jgi:hypothetical protein
LQLILFNNVVFDSDWDDPLEHFPEGSEHVFQLLLVELADVAFGVLEYVLLHSRLHLLHHLFGIGPVEHRGQVA